MLLHGVGFLTADDPRFIGTVNAVGNELRRGDFIFRYVGEDDFGVPAKAFAVCTFWYIYALAAIGRMAEARELFEKLLACRNRHGLRTDCVPHAIIDQPNGDFRLLPRQQVSRARGLGHDVLHNLALIQPY